MTNLVLSGCLWIPANSRQAQRLRDEYTVDYWQLGSQESIHVAGYVESEGWIGIPRQAGLQSIANYPEFMLEDARSRGQPVRFKRAPQLRPAQVPFVDAMYAAATSDYPDFMAYAATGKGKTVCGLAVAARLGRNVVIFVDQERLMKQWIERAQEHLGADEDIAAEDVMKGRGREIGICQGDLCNYEGRKIVVAMIQSVSVHQYPQEFYDAFGTAIFDEAHVAGAPVFSRVLLLFSALVRFGVSATPDRNDALRKLLLWSLGEIEARMEDRHKASRVYYVETEAVYSWYSNKAKTTGRYLSEVAADAGRNLILAQVIEWLYSSGRDVLIIGDRIEHLCNLMALCRAIGLPDEDMGLYARYRVVWGYEKDPTPVRRPSGWVKDVEYTPVRFGPLSKRMLQEELDYTFANARLIFATYKMFEKGVDCPRLSGGVDITPRAASSQVHGRLLRTMAGKKLPIWVTPRDVWSFRAEYQFLGRIDDYVTSSGEIYRWQLNSGIQRQDVPSLRAEVRERIALLKRQKITTRRDGSNTVTTPVTPSDSARQHAEHIVRTTRSRPAV